jgi:PTH1 family peptidyl-tRNA hydrolase
MKLIVGLGNPEPRYATTRHNAGWRVAEALAARAAASAWREKFAALLAEARWGTERVVLARPLTYMNLSGQAVRELVDFWKVEQEDLLVVVDDFALDLGRIRLRAEGSAGGHNGLESIIAHLGREQFARIRVGLGPMPKGVDQAAYVLSEFPASERPVLEEVIDRAADAAECWILMGLQEAMSRFNRPKDDS